MFLCQAGSPLPLVKEKLKILPLLVVQEKLKTFNVGQAFETQLELHKFFADSHFHLDKLLDKLKVNNLRLNSEDTSVMEWMFSKIKYVNLYCFLFNSPYLCHMELKQSQFSLKVLKFISFCHLARMY